MKKRLAGLLGGALCLVGTAPAWPDDKDKWAAPFGGSWTASFAVTTDYAYRGISQTQRQPAVQALFGYETPTISETVPLSAYLGAWGSNVNFPGSGAVAEIDLTTGARLKLLDDKLTFDLGYIRYNYPGAPANLFFDFSEFGLVAGYDLGAAQLSGAVRYSPNFFANSGDAWYKWGQVVVPFDFIKTGDNLAFKAFGTVGNQSVARFANYGIGSDNYWDWQIGVTATVYGVDLTFAYVDTNLDAANCGSTQNCAARAIFTITKSF
ncbi:MAG: hypothetical protein FJX11_15680 [Alphaproteobacteria bacterium]|nr:hypothetical protein [Alphaproteobacteria bacterium]